MKRPASVTHGLVASIGLFSFLFSLVVLKIFHPFDQNLVLSSLFVIALVSGAIFAVDILVFKVYLRPSAGLNFQIADPSWSRTRIKLLGFLGSLGFIGFLYWLFPEYRQANTYSNYYLMLELIAIPVLVIAVPYFYWIDSRMREPADGYWHMGRLMIGDWGLADKQILSQHILGWIVKGFFLPLMFIYLCDDIGTFMKVDFASYKNFQSWYGFFYDFAFLLDLSLVAMGYMMCFRITDTHMRSVEPTILGWTVALICYKPFWGFFEGHYLSYESNFPWGAWLWGIPVMYGVWGCSILFLLFIYAWSTVSFGARFSNLTNRGIITNGPYKWTKHPSYISKNLSWWMVSTPFLLNGNPAETLRHSLLLLALNGVYIMRAKTEEWHLSQDENYVQYALWMERHGLFRWIRSIPFLNQLAYKKPSPTLVRAATK